MNNKSIEHHSMDQKQKDHDVEDQSSHHKCKNHISTREIFRRGACYIFGLLILALGITFVIRSELGASSWDALHVGLSLTYGRTVGTWVIIVGGILILMNALIMWEKPKILPVLTIFILGGFIDFWNLFVFGWLEMTSLVYQIPLFILGLPCMGFGIATYLHANFALIPIDGFMMAIKKRLKVSLGMAKTLAELFALIFAILFSGPVWIGTLIITFTIGFLIQFFYRKLALFMRPFL